MAESALTRMMMAVLNSSMKLILRSPLHGMASKTILLITFTGRKSGKSYTTPISYSTQGEFIVLVTESNWWKNLRGGAAVTLRLRGQDCTGTAEPIAEDKTAVAEGLLHHLEQVPSDAKFYSVSLDAERKPNPEQVAKAAQKLILIRIRL
jgi:deazaflavin-dependent oxidoreductase (nitroreductase family)